jgi:hypothetical protein
MSDKISDILKQIGDLGKEVLETIRHKAKLSTIFDLYTEKIIPSFVSEKELKEYYEKRMEDVNNVIDKL